MPHELPIIDSIDKLNDEKLQALMKVGFAYVKIPNLEIVRQPLKAVRQTALDFFALSDEDKKKFPVGEDMAGYADRRKGSKSQRLEQFFFRPNKPLSKFKEVQADIDIIQDIFKDSIAMSLLKKIFIELGIGEKFENAMKGAVSSLSFPYYPKTDAPPSKQMPALNEHKDFDYFTVLQITKPGLQVWIEDSDSGKWVDVLPKPGYFVVNLGNALELALDKRVNSALHRVKYVSNEARLSTGLFIGPAWNGPLINLFTNEILYSNYKNDYLPEQFRTQYSDPQEKNTTTALIETTTSGRLMWKGVESQPETVQEEQTLKSAATHGM